MTFHLYWTIALFLVFLAIFAWAWSGRRKQDFTEAANLPLDGDSEPGDPGENDHTFKRG